MGVNIPFQPMGKTIQIVTNASTANNLTLTADSPCQQYRIANHAAQPVYLVISPTANAVTAVAPTGNGAKAQYALCIPNGTVAVVTGPQTNSNTPVQISAIAESGTPEVYITPGEGMF